MSDVGYDDGEHYRSSSTPLAHSWPGSSTPSTFGAGDGFVQYTHEALGVSALR